MLRVGIVPSPEGSLPDAIIAADPKFSAAQADSNQILWLALTLTPGLGPTRSRRLVEVLRHRGPRLQRIAHRTRSLRVTRAIGAGASHGGRSVELANEEMARAAAADVHLLAFDDPAYPARLRQIYDPPLVLYSGRMFGRTAAGCATCPHPAGRR